MIEALWRTFRAVGFADVLDMAVVACFIYIILRWFEWTKAAFVARGILILTALYLIARQMNMVLTTWLFHGFFAIILIALVVIFQEEIRHFFERLASWSWRHPQRLPLTSQRVELLVRSLSVHARARVGALIVIKGKDPLTRHVEGGHELDGCVSEPLLQSIFDVHSDGHDGAVVIEDDRIKSFSVHLPLSKNFDRLSGMGTRHAAALGLSEVCDALCLVVSEQKGTISVASRGQWLPVDGPDQLESVIQNHLNRLTRPVARRNWKDMLLENKSEKVIAAATSLALWLIFVQGFKPEQIEFPVTLLTEHTPPNLQLRTLDPHKVHVTLSGLKRDLDSLNPARLRGILNLEDVTIGNHRIPITEEDLRLPGGIRFVSSNPPEVEVVMGRQPPPAPIPVQQGPMPPSAVQSSTGAAAGAGSSADEDSP